MYDRSVAVSPSALTSLANLKSVLSIAAADTSKDTLLELTIDRATAWIENATERKLKARNYNGSGTAFTTTGVTSEDYLIFSGTTKDRGGDTVVDPQGYGQFYLPQFPVQANSVSQAITFALHALTDREAGTWDTSSLVENSDYVIDRTNGVLTLLNGPFTPGLRNYRITCTAGYLTSAQPYVPADLEELCIAVAKKMFRNEQGLQSESIGTWSRTYNVAEQNALIDETLARYRRFAI